MQKTLFRQLCKDKLIKIKNSKNSLKLDYKIQTQLKKELDTVLRTLKKQGKKKVNILFYYPLALEFNCRKLLFHYRMQQNIKIFLPFMHNFGFKMVKFRFPLQKKAFGVYEPSNSSYKNTKIDIAIIPVIGMDQNFKRIGFGKGMYDRAFSHLKSKPYNIFICRAINYTHYSITQPHDIQASSFITPFLSLKSKRKNHGNLGYNKLHSFCLHRGRRKLPHLAKALTQ
ncbi:5-formyltetrahydrofolate cyclo-ligase [Helicobacter valdiviensis]|uniref:5-formyltetrahydrofolate cyclo-ligase n=1 Tax=Helicobacter valdiviensis TaxID=1458358 RepID=A0A2W6MXT6_9HELI|nr:5-formyltetrahydrofolate cyclo-ligase [Helicobacter valdiviensis]PZT48819.1 5-formyltetrahydrofolate cyclo-ligase [Helicobacter valdiviensis]